MLICFIAVQMVMSRASIDRIYEVLETEPDIKDGPGTQTVADGSIKFDHVNFSYSNNKDNLTLEDINLDIASGETVGIVGGTGDGKSSLAQLIPRFYDVLSGSVIVGGEDVETTLCSTCVKAFPWCCKRTCCSPALFVKTCFGATRTPRRNK